MSETFQGGVSRGGKGQADARARVALQGASLHALTGNETFRIPLSRCSLERAGRRTIVRDGQGSLAIWSEDEGFLDALERAQHGTLRDQVRRLQRTARRRRLVKRWGLALLVVAAGRAASVPVARWAIRGGVPSVGDRMGESALERLALPSGLAPAVEQELGVIAERLRPATAPSIRSFRVLFADYAQQHSFGLPPSTVIVTAGLVCGADGPDPVMEAVARELAHLEGGDARQRVAEAVDWQTVLDLARGDTSKPNARMLDFADPRRSPGFTPEQETAADERASRMLKRAGVAPAAGPKLASTRVSSLDPAAPSDWSKVRAEACGLIGR